MSTTRGIERIFHKNDGFTLVELLVSVVILSVGIVSVLHAFQSALFALGASRDHLWGGLLIEEKIADMYVESLGDPDTVPVSSSGDFEDSYSDFRWETVVSQVDVQQDADGNTNGLARIDVSVWRSGVTRQYSSVVFRRY